MVLGSPMWIYCAKHWQLEQQFNEILEGEVVKVYCSPNRISEMPGLAVFREEFVKIG